MKHTDLRKKNRNFNRRKDKLTRQRTVYLSNTLCGRNEGMNQLSVERHLQ